MAAANVKHKSALEHVLACNKCENIIQQPHTLKQCQHSFCKGCLEGISKQDQDEQSGRICPTCSVFTEEQSISKNEFLVHLQELTKEQSDCELKNQKTCMQCWKTDKTATGKCLDCKLTLCDDCQFSHKQIPMLKDHKISKFDEEHVVVVDKLIYCNVHESKPLEFNCESCEELVCLTCILSDHNRHNTETIDQALDRLLPHLRSNCDSLKAKTEAIETQLACVNQEIEKTKETYSSCRLELDEKLEVVINRLKAAKAEMEEEVNEQETIALDIFKNIKSNLEHQLHIVTNLTSLLDVTTERARHTSLLNELQNGLYSTTTDKAQEPVKSFEMEIKMPQVGDIKNIEINCSIPEFRNIIADLKYNNCIYKIDEVGVIWSQNEFLCDNLKQVFKQRLIRDKEIKLDVESVDKMSYIDGKIWLPCHNGKCLVYDNYGKLVDTCTGNFTVIRKANNGDLIAGGSDGLYLRKGTCSEWSKLADGSYCDIYVHGVKFSALKEDKYVTTYKLIKTNTIHWVEETTVELLTDVKMSIYNCSLLVDRKKYLFFLFTGGQNIEFSDKGSYRSSTSHHTLFMAVCGGDKYGYSAFCDFHSGKIYLKDQAKGSISNRLERWVCNQNIKGSSLRDMIVDSENNVWYLEGKWYQTPRLVKYIHQ